MQAVQSCLHCQYLCHVLKALFFYQNSLKISYFCKKMQIFRAMGAQPPDPQNSPPIANFWLRAWLQVIHIKGGESSSQFRWFTIVKIELQFLIFFVLILGLRLQRHSTYTKRYPPKKVFGTS